jgi:carbohydrate kinase (thermoresistant glucokinase family)
VLIVVMGVSGVGKTTAGRLVAAELGLPFHDADELHPEENRRKMAAGIPLTETDREPWLRDLARRMAEWEAAGGAVVACSALRERHRELLAAASPGHVAFVFLDAAPEVIHDRLAARVGHYMPPTLLDSQLATLEPPGPDEALNVDAGGTPLETARAVVSGLRESGRR